MNRTADDAKFEDPREVLANQRKYREAFAGTNLGLPAVRVRRERDLRALSSERSETARVDEPHRSVEYLSIKAELHQRLLDELDERNLLGSREDELSEVIAAFVQNVLAK